MEDYTGSIGDPDDDGYCLVVVIGPDYEGRHVVRYDQARQWLGQELDILNGRSEMWAR